MLPVYRTGNRFLKPTIQCCIALVWLINGLFCKILSFTPRHQLIIAQILGESHAYLFTKVIGTLEILMFVWVISNIWPRLCSVFQIIIILTMNVMEFILVPDMLLFGHINIIVAIFFTSIIFFNQFILKFDAKPV